MIFSKSFTVAKADLKLAMRLRMVKYGLLAMSAMGPVMGVFMIVITGIALPPGDPQIALIFPMASAMLAVFAIIPATIISANALVGEREQKTLEPLLCTPLTDRELLLGKTLSSFIPGIILLYGSMAATMIASRIIFLVIGLPVIQFPDLPGFFLIGVISPIMLLAVVAVMILISGKVKRVYEAYQISGSVVTVLLIPMFAPIFMLEQGNIDLSKVWLVTIITFLIAVVLMISTWTLALKRFNRDNMVSRV